MQDSGNISNRGLIEQLEALLERERQMLLSGNLDALPELVDEKETLISALASAEPAAADLEQAQDRMIHNQALLESAMQGIRSVAERMRELRNVRNGLQTYDRTGRRQRISGNYAPKLEKRA